MEPDKTFSNEALDYFGVDIKDAERGAKKFGEIFSKLDRSTQRDLSTSEQAFGELASFSVGIKPAVMIDDPEKVEFAKKFTENTSETSIIGNFLVWNNRAMDVVRANPDVFTDYDGQPDLKMYLEKTLSEDGVPNKDFKLGLLLGYPKEASELYAKHISAYSSFFRSVFSDIVGGGKQFDPAVVQFFRDFVHTGTHDDIERSNRFRDTHQQEAYNLIKSLSIFEGYSDEQIKYICNTRGVQSKGLSYMGVAGTDSYDKVPKYVDQVFEISGLNSEVGKIQKDLQGIEYTTDYPLAVKAVSGGIADIIGNHMMWGLMQNDPELKIKAEFKSLREQVIAAVSVSREGHPGKDVDQFEKDFLLGFDTLSQAILKAVNENGGIYMSGTLRELPKITGLNWIATEALEILNHSGFDVKPIIKKIESSPDIEGIRATDIFVEVFPKPAEI